MSTPAERILHDALRDHIQTFERYRDFGLEPGSCSRAILENNLLETVRRADHPTRFLLAQLVTFVYSELPMECWGSRQKVDAWIKAKREAGNA